MDTKTGKFVKASVESRYACPGNAKHPAHSANLEPKNNGYYACEGCGWTNQPKVKA